MAYEDGTGKVGSSDEAAGIVRIQRRIQKKTASFETWKEVAAHLQESNRA